MQHDREWSLRDIARFNRQEARKPYIGAAVIVLVLVVGYMTY